MNDFLILEATYGILLGIGIDLLDRRQDGVLGLWANV